MKWIKILVIATTLVIWGVAIWVTVSYSEDTEGINFHFSHKKELQNLKHF